MSTPYLYKPEGVNLADEYMDYLRRLQAEGADFSAAAPPGEDEYFGRRHLSTSSIGTLLACQQRFHWNYEKRLDPAVKPVALQMGTAFAEAVERGDPEHGYELIRDDWRALCERYEGHPWVVVPEKRSAVIMAATVRGASRAYLARYGRRERREHTMRVRLRNPRTGHFSRTFDLVCRVDGLSHDGLLLIEDKLVGQIPRAPGVMDRRLRLDRQVSINCYAAWRTSGVVVDEVDYRMTLKPSIEPRKGRLKDGVRTGVESFEDYIERVEKEYAERPDHYLASFPVKRTLDDMLRLECELWRWAEQLRDARRDGVWPRNSAACMDYGGCAYLALCAGEPGAEAQYVERPHHVAQPTEVPA